MNKHVSNYISLTKALAKENNVEVRFGRGKRVNCDGKRTNGYFDSNVLITATGKPIEEWIGTFVHESSHMDQYIEDSKYWKAATDENYTLLEEFLAGDDVGISPELFAAVDTIVELEADCERRTYKKIQEHNLPISLDDYARRGNAYLFFHKVMLLEKKWYVTAPYEIKKIFNQMPTTIGAPSSYRMNKVKVDLDLFKGCFRK